jgi:predicted transposase YdaD
VSKIADIGSKRLISLAPETWVRWVTGDPTAAALDFLSGEFEWVSRATDVLIKARSERHGTFLVANEIQFRPDARMPQRLRAYAALAEERYGLLVYPVVVNLLPPRPSLAIAASYHSELMGLVAHQDFKVLNLWEVDADLVLEQRWSTLLPFVPVMRGGHRRAVLSQALALLRHDEQLADMESLLAFFATFVMTPDEVVKMMRWNMTMLRESPWYLEIEAEAIQKGMQQGLQQGQAEMVLRVLSRRFGAVPSRLAAAVRAAPGEQLPDLLDVALAAGSLDEVAAAVEALAAGGGNGKGSPLHP